MCKQDQSGCESRCPAPSQPHRCHWKQEAERRLATKRCFITHVHIVEVHKALHVEHVLEVHIIHRTNHRCTRRTHSKRSRSTHSTHSKSTRTRSTHSTHTRSAHSTHENYTKFTQSTYYAQETYQYTQYTLLKYRVHSLEEQVQHVLVHIVHVPEVSVSARILQHVLELHITLPYIRTQVINAYTTHIRSTYTILLYLLEEKYI